MPATVQGLETMASMASSYASPSIVRDKHLNCLLPLCSMELIKNALAPEIGLRQWVTSESPCAQRRYHYRQPVNTKYTETDDVAGVGVSGEIKILTGLVGTPNAGKKFVLKSLPIASERTWTTTRNEVKVMLKLDHPNVARLEDAFETRSHMCLVMEYCSGKEVYDRLIEKGRFTEKEAAITLRQMLRAVNHLHTRDSPIVHRDLKPENFMYESEESCQLAKPCVKMIDFGLALTLNHRHEQRRKSVAGTRLYSAPEVFTGEVTSKVDLWSLGVTAYTILTGRLMFEEKKIGQSFTWQYALKDAFARKEYTGLSYGARSFIECLVCVDANMRVSSEEALAHYWIKSQSTSTLTNIQPLNILQSVCRYAKASSFRRACLHMMAWELSPRECEDLRETFEQIDTDHSGTICTKEFREALLDNFEVDHNTVDEIFKCVDQDGNEHLSYSEFLAAAMQDRVRKHEDTVRSTFARFDIGNKGFLTVRDLEKNLGNAWEGVSVEDLFTEADPKKTQKIVCEQFVEFLRRDENESDSPTNDLLVSKTPSGDQPRLTRCTGQPLLISGEPQSQHQASTSLSVSKAVRSMNARWMMLVCCLARMSLTYARFPS